MMTRTGKAMFGLHALVLIGCSRAAGIALDTRLWALAATLLAMAGVALAAILREVSRADLDESGYDGPQWLFWLRNHVKARRTRVPSCCETWWETLGEVHDGPCRKGLARRSDYLAEAGDDE